MHSTDGSLLPRNRPSMVTLSSWGGDSGRPVRAEPGRPVGSAGIPSRQCRCSPVICPIPHEHGGSPARSNSAASDRKVAAVPEPGPVVLQSGPISSGDPPRKRPLPAPIPLFAALVGPGPRARAAVHRPPAAWHRRARDDGVPAAGRDGHLPAGADRSGAAAAATVGPRRAARAQRRLGAPPRGLRGRRVSQRAAPAWARISQARPGPVPSMQPGGPSSAARPVHLTAPALRPAG